MAVEPEQQGNDYSAEPGGIRERLLNLLASGLTPSATLDALGPILADAPPAVVADAQAALAASRAALDAEYAALDAEQAAADACGRDHPEPEGYVAGILAAAGREEWATRVGAEIRAGACQVEPSGPEQIERECGDDPAALRAALDAYGARRDARVEALAAAIQARQGDALADLRRTRASADRLLRDLSRRRARPVTPSRWCQPARARQARRPRQRTGTSASRGDPPDGTGDDGPPGEPPPRRHGEQAHGGAHALGIRAGPLAVSPDHARREAAMPRGARARRRAQNTTQVTVVQVLAYGRRLARRGRPRGWATPSAGGAW